MLIKNTNYHREESEQSYLERKESKRLKKERKEKEKARSRRGSISSIMEDPDETILENK